MVKKTGSINSHALTIQPETIIHTGLRRDLWAKMDIILRAIQGYEGKSDTMMELMLDMQKRFEEKLEAPR